MARQRKPYENLTSTELPEEPVVAEAPAWAPVVEEPVAPVVAEVKPELPANRVRVRAVSRGYYNPYTQTRFRPGVEMEHELDSWLQCQLAAGYIERV